MNANEWGYVQNDFNHRIMIETPTKKFKMRSEGIVFNSISSFSMTDAHYTKSSADIGIQVKLIKETEVKMNCDGLVPGKTSSLFYLDYRGSKNFNSVRKLFEYYGNDINLMKEFISKKVKNGSRIKK